MMKRLLVLSIGFLIGVSLVGTLVPAAQAQVRVPSDINSYVEYFTDEEPSMPDLEAAGIASDMAAIGCLVTGQCVNSEGEQAFEHSLVGDTVGTMAFMYDNRPANTATYVADLMNSVGGFGAQTAYAQDTRGVGFVGLQPVLQIWKAFRNITYFLFVIFLVILGFMIMFRAQINPQTIVSLQSALPSIVVTLIVITFSYAIAGFVVDMIFFSIYLIAGIFELGGLLATGNAFTAAEALLSRSIFGIGFRYFLGFGEAAGRIAYSVNLLVREVFSTIPLGGEYIIGGIASVFTYLIAAIAIVIAIFRTFFALLKAYIALILHVITAPLQLLFNAFPGSGALGSWLRNIVANAAVFPATAAFILLGIVLMGYDAQALPEDALIGQETEIDVVDGVGFGRSAWTDGSEDPGGFSPPFLVPGNSGTADVLQAIIGFGIIMLLPEVTQIVRGFFGVEDQYGELALQNAMRGSGPVTAPFRMVRGLATSLFGGILGGVTTQVGSHVVYPELARRYRSMRGRGTPSEGGSEEDVIADRDERVPGEGAYDK